MLVDVRQLKLTLQGHEILCGVRLSMNAGQIYGLLGPNGAGKSTTLSVLTGLRPASAGSVQVLGMDAWTQREQVHQQIGVLPEQAGFYEWMDGPEHLRWFGGLYGKSPDEQCIAAQLRQVGLDPANRQPVGAYSRGMRQRLGLARALLHRPRLLVLDEPTNGLDPRGRREIHDVLLTLSREADVGILLCTHLLDDVDRLCSRIGILHHGNTVTEGDLVELVTARQAGQLYRLRLGKPQAPARYPPGVSLIAQEGEWCRVRLDAGLAPPAAWRALLELGWQVSEIRGEGSGLEDLYLQLTQERS